MVILIIKTRNGSLAPSNHWLHSWPLAWPIIQDIIVVFSWGEFVREIWARKKFRGDIPWHWERMALISVLKKREIVVAPWIVVGCGHFNIQFRNKSTMFSLWSITMMRCLQTMCDTYLDWQILKSFVMQLWQPNRQRKMSKQSCKCHMMK